MPLLETAWNPHLFDGWNCPELDNICPISRCLPSRCPLQDAWDADFQEILRQAVADGGVSDLHNGMVHN
jgi:hypothetical protein